MDAHTTRLGTRTPPIFTKNKSSTLYSSPDVAFANFQARFCRGFGFQLVERHGYLLSEEDYALHSILKESYTQFWAKRRCKPKWDVYNKLVHALVGEEMAARGGARIGAGNAGTGNAGLPLMQSDANIIYTLVPQLRRASQDGYLDVLRNILFALSTGDGLKQIIEDSGVIESVSSILNTSTLKKTRTLCIGILSLIASIDQEDDNITGKSSSGTLWSNQDQFAGASIIRATTAPLLSMLHSSNPTVSASALQALGSLINSTQPILPQLVANELLTGSFVHEIPGLLISNNNNIPIHTKISALELLSKLIMSGQGSSIIQNGNDNQVGQFGNEDIQQLLGRILGSVEELILLYSGNRGMKDSQSTQLKQKSENIKMLLEGKGIQVEHQGIKGNEYLDDSASQALRGRQQQQYSRAQYPQQQLSSQPQAQPPQIRSPNNQAGNIYTLQNQSNQSPNAQTTTYTTYVTSPELQGADKDSVASRVSNVSMTTKSTRSGDISYSAQPLQYQASVSNVTLTSNSHLSNSLTTTYTNSTYSSSSPDAVIRQDGSRFYAKKDNAPTTIGFDPIIISGSGIWRFEIKFKNTSYMEGRHIGIFDSNFVIPNTYYPGQSKESAGYNGSNGTVTQNGKPKDGNDRFQDNVTISAEVDMNSIPRTLTFFVEEKQQPVFVSNIPESIRFCAYRSFSKSSFQIVSLCQLEEAIAIGAKNRARVAWEN
ncbi:MAG: hypothetical protein EZS28_017996 [Streblomastix strix]|uniref:Uncharacterized protein n=1 Tax=Streblomastix strix TaxID=222440 RepID=A0A5J4VUZ2_9EUKA|nr:MAG: hypothetical protein EZS28_017996 [Streblomastix strix]